ncbi:hypothetical protein V2I01_00420 [Micromonospora sp. BRA006-A]|nr:hypothetical protein [Micromonospora sp. BRA006-A]
MRQLVAHFGGDWPDGDLAAVLAGLDAFSARRWDFRQGRERPDAREPAFDPATAGLVLSTAATLGLVRAAAPARSGYAHLLVLGGLAHACLRRTAYAATLARTAAEVTGEVAVLGSFRPLSAAESHARRRRPVRLRHQVDVLDAGVRLAFGVDAPDDEHGEPAGHPHRAWSSRTYRRPGCPRYGCSPRRPANRTAVERTPPTRSGSGPSTCGCARTTRC